MTQAFDGHRHDAADASAAECVEFFESIIAMVDGELGEGECAAVREHLESCNPCLARYDIQRTVKQIVARSCSEVAPEELRLRIVTTLSSITIAGLD